MTEDSDRQTEARKNEDLAVLSLKRAIADEILRQSKAKLEGDEGKIAKAIEESKKELLKSLDKCQTTSIKDAEKAAHKAVVENINKELIGDSKEAKETLAQLGYDENNPKTISQLLQLKHERLFEETLKNNVGWMSLSPDLSAEAIHNEADQLKHSHERNYLNELQVLIVKHNQQAASIKNSNNIKELCETLANLIEKDNTNVKGTIETALAKAELEKQHLEDEQNWIDRCLHQARMFALSCGTTIAGAILLLVAQYTSTTIFAICVFLSPLVVLIVTKANWWLSATPIVGVMNDIIKFIRMNDDQREEEYKKYSKTWLITFAVFSVTGGIIWGVFTYDATEKLMFEIGKEFSQIPGFTAEGLACFLAASFIVKGLYDLYQCAFVEKRRNSRIIQTIRGLGLLTSAALMMAAVIVNSSTLATIAFAYTFSALMGIYTVPTIFAVFYYFGKRWAYKEKLTEFNDISFKTMNKKLEDNVKIMGETAVNNRFVKWFLPVGIILLGTVCLLAAPYVAEILLLINKDFFGFKEVTNIIEAVVASAMMGIVGMGALAWRSANGPTSSLAQAKMAFYILAFAAIWGGISVVLASSPITADFLQLLGVGTDKAEKDIAPWLAIGLGALVTVWFYFSSAINSAIKLFSKEDLFHDAKSLQSNSVGIDHGPDFNQAVENVAQSHRTSWEKFKDSATSLWHWVWPYTNDKEARFKTVVIANGTSNAAANCYGALEASNNVASVVSAGLSGGLSSIVANINGNNDAPQNNDEKIKVAEGRCNTLKLCVAQWGAVIPSVNEGSHVNSHQPQKHLVANMKR